MNLIYTILSSIVHKPIPNFLYVPNFSTTVELNPILFFVCTVWGRVGTYIRSVSQWEPYHLKSCEVQETGNEGRSSQGVDIQQWRHRSEIKIKKSLEKFRTTLSLFTTYKGPKRLGPCLQIDYVMRWTIAIKSTVCSY